MYVLFLYFKTFFKLIFYVFELFFMFSKWANIKNITLKKKNIILIYF
jgi:hypothetical protein